MLFDFYNSIYYVCRRHLHFTEYELDSVDVSDVFVLLKYHNEEQMNREIMQIQLAGYDPKKIPAYSEKLSGAGKRKVSLPKDEAMIYKNIFESIPAGKK